MLGASVLRSHSRIFKSQSLCDSVIGDFHVLIDDLGFADTQFHNPDTPTPQIGELAREGLVLMNLHTYLYCSPTRRSILSGRFPVHIAGVQAGACSNYLPLQMTLLPAKLRQAGFKGHM